MCPAIVSGIVTGHAPVTVPEVFAKVYLTQFPFRFQRGELPTLLSEKTLSTIEC